jgi:hypothetical protein
MRRSNVEIRCKCGKKFNGQQFEDGTCPKCGAEYGWDVWSMDDYDDPNDEEIIVVDWKKPATVTTK